jgi:glycerophosphoryl diester phosphodiesterase
MRNRARALRAVLAGGIALVLTAPIAYAESMDEVTVAHRGASTSKFGEGTLPAYKYAVRNRADILDADVRWTKDGPDADSVGTMVILHDKTLDRVTNCTGTVSSRLWSKIRDKCRTDIGGQPLMRVIDLLSYADSVGKSVALEIKVSLDQRRAGEAVVERNQELEDPVAGDTLLSRCTEQDQEVGRC